MRILITAGPTREPIDPVRYISNRSSGRMGYALASAATSRGHRVVLISGPVALAEPPGVRVVQVTTAREMQAAVRLWFDRSDALIMAAAVADWRVRAVSRQKLKKRSGTPVLRLVRNPDILKGAGRCKAGRLVVGFAAETSRVIAEARRKLADKRLDLMVANDVSRADSGFDVDTNQATLLGIDGSIERLPLMTKRALAKRIVERVEQLRQSRQSRRGALTARYRRQSR